MGRLQPAAGFSPPQQSYNTRLPAQLIRAWTYTARLIATLYLVSAVAELQSFSSHPRAAIFLLLDGLTLTSFYVLPALFLIQIGILVASRLWRPFLLSTALFAVSFAANRLVTLAALFGVR